jgi:hypothetical protein
VESTKRRARLKPVRLPDLWKLRDLVRAVNRLLGYPAPSPIAQDGPIASQMGPVAQP